MIELSAGGGRLLAGLMEIPPDFQALRRELEAGDYTEEDVSMAAAQFSEELFYEKPEEDYETHVFPGTRRELVALYLRQAHALGSGETVK